MNDLKIFNNEEFGEIRTVTINNEPYFVGNDVATILGYAEPRSTVSKKVDAEDKGVAKLETPSGIQEMTVINESGLYSLILGSKLESAKRFKHWITSEVLPSIRKNGGYIAGQETLSDDELLEKAVLVAQKKIAERDLIIQRQREEIEADKPKIIFADAVSASGSSILIGQLAKLLRQNGVDIGQNRLFDWMRKNAFLGNRGENYNMPTQKSMDMELLEIKETTSVNPDGSIRTNKTPKVTGKGQQYFINKFLRKTELGEV